MITQIKEIYRCEHCNKLYQIKNACAKHEELCLKNPKNFRACLNGCVHLNKKTTEISYDAPDGGERYREVELLHCDKLNTFLYPPKVEAKKNWYETSDTENNPMPKVCKDFTGYF
jgi:hypothetical protein